MAIQLVRPNAGVFYKNEQVFPRAGETLLQAYSRQQNERLSGSRGQRSPATPAAAQPSTPQPDPAVVAVHREAAELWRQQEILRLQNEHLKLQSQNAELEKKIAKKLAREKGFAGHIRISGGFNAFTKSK